MWKLLLTQVNGEVILRWVWKSRRSRSLGKSFSCIFSQNSTLVLNVWWHSDFCQQQPLCSEAASQV